MRHAGAVLATLLLVPAALVAQGRETCEVVFYGVVRGGVVTTSSNTLTLADGSKQTFISGGVDATCAGQGNRLLADSAEHYQDRGELILINRVRYTEPRMNMQSDRMVYYTREDRLIATGNVRGKTNTGTRFTGPLMEYFRAKPGVRAQPSWRAPGRPFVRMAPQDTTARRRPRPGETVESDSVDITADLVISQNDSLVWASGDVVIERPDMRATGDSATLDEGIGFARLLKGPKIVGRGERPFTMVGTEIDMWSKEQKLERVLASGEASVVSDSLNLVGDTIDLRFADQLMQRVFTWGGRAKADTPQQQMEADSLEILMPGQQLRELHAVGKAIAYTVVDTLRIASEERDWISGDTIVAFFDSTATGDSTRTQMKQVTASGTARAYYQLAPSSGVKGPPNVSYNRGREIIVSFEEGEVSKVDVRDRASGIFLEPIAPPAAPAADSTRPPTAKPDPKKP
jgi:lipopolysaccharide export system protein LptA